MHSLLLAEHIQIIWPQQLQLEQTLKIPTHGFVRGEELGKQDNGTPPYRFCEASRHATAFYIPRVHID